MPAPPDDETWLATERRSLGNRIRDARVDANMTQEQVFLAVPMNRRTYQEIEAGKGNPTFTTLLRISRALHLHPAELFRS